jgi:xanthine dehydrogenase YagR molybdenum-binding subunit
VTGAGKVMNAKTARSQIIGGCVWGIGMALTEGSVLDRRWGNFVTRTYNDYHIPAHLDVGSIDVAFIPEDDKAVNKLGIKGVGEVGIVGVAGAIANAIFNATGKRVRELPITPDKLL